VCGQRESPQESYWKKEAVEDTPKGLREGREGPVPDDERKRLR